jgi:hypothetical protein
VSGGVASRPVSNVQNAVAHPTHVLEHAIDVIACCTRGDCVMVGTQRCISSRRGC